MRKYCLKTKDGEVINKVEAKSLDLAIELFERIKHLSSYDSLETYNVE